MIQDFFCGITFGCLMGFALQWISKRQISQITKRSFKPSGDIVQKTTNGEHEYKLALVVNNELKMGKGKVLAQSAHAALGVYESYYLSNRNNFNAWERQGKPMTVYKVSDKNDLKSINEIAESMSIITCLVRDAGRTQIPSGSITVLALGPEESSKLHCLTEHLLTYS